MFAPESNAMEKQVKTVETPWEAIIICVSASGQELRSFKCALNLEVAFLVRIMLYRLIFGNFWGAKKIIKFLLASYPCSHPSSYQFLFSLIFAVVSFAPT